MIQIFIFWKIRAFWNLMLFMSMQMAKTYVEWNEDTVHITGFVKIITWVKLFDFE